MAHAFSGQLLAEGSVTEHLERIRNDGQIDSAYRRFRHARQGSRLCGPASSLRAVAEIAVEPVARALGYQPAATAIEGLRPSGTATFGSMHTHTPAGRVPWLVTLWGAGLEPMWRTAVYAARLTDSRWIFLSNGIRLRLLDAASGHVRRWIEFDLDSAAGDRSAFAALWLVARATALSHELPGLVAQSDAFATDLCRSLRGGVLEASEHLLGAVVGRQRSMELSGALDQALTVVYRILFLLFAESRRLVPMWHPVYRRGYSIEALRRSVERGTTVGLWDALRAISRLAHAGLRHGALRVTPFNGRLFDGQRTPLVSHRGLDDRAAGQALLSLTSRVSRVRGGREPIGYRDLGVEQLGAVYETLLDYEPRWRDGVPRLQLGSDARKSSGSFYTPGPIAHYLVARTLAPLVQSRSAAQILELRVLDPSMGSGAFLVAACGYLADAYEQALVAAGECHAHDITEQDRVGFRRTIAERCLFGVDVNPMAVQLGRLSLWLTTLSRNRPLSFLDHHIRVGDSLLGAWLSMLVRSPRPAHRLLDGRTPGLFESDRLSADARSWLPTRFALTEPGDTLDAVRRKERMLNEVERDGSPLRRWRQVADLWCSAWFGDLAATAQVFPALVDAILDPRQRRLPSRLADRHLAQASAIAREKRFFHWELEFPEVFFDPDGARRPDAGFDAVVGNPPWDMIRGDSGASGVRVSRRREAGAIVRFVRDAGAYDLPAVGQINRYQLFVERSIALLRDGGRCGLVLPGGILSDKGSGPLRRLLFNRCQVDGIVSFENRRRIFPIHRTMRFVLATATRGRPSDRFGVRLGESDPAVLQRDDTGRDAWFPIHLSIGLLARLSGDDLAVPAFTSPVDLVLVERLTARYPRLGSSAGWGAEFGRELNATDDRDLLRPPGAGLPIVEGKLLTPFRVDVGRARHSIRRTDAPRRLGARSRYVRLAYRDVASASNRQTLIAALLPSDTVSTHTVFTLKTPLPLSTQHFLCGLFNSFVVNYLVRLRVTTHVTTAIVEHVPVPLRSDHPGLHRRIAAIARRLSRTSDGDVRGALLDRLNAAVASVYELSVAEYAHVLETFPLVPAAERAGALAAYRGKPG